MGGANAASHGGCEVRLVLVVALLVAIAASDESPATATQESSPTRSGSGCQGKGCQQSHTVAAGENEKDAMIAKLRESNAKAKREVQAAKQESVKTRESAAKILAEVKRHAVMLELGEDKERGQSPKELAARVAAKVKELQKQISSMKFGVHAEVNQNKGGKERSTLKNKKKESIASTVTAVTAGKEPPQPSTPNETPGAADCAPNHDVWLTSKCTEHWRAHKCEDPTVKENCKSTCGMSVTPWGHSFVKKASGTPGSPGATNSCSLKCGQSACKLGQLCVKGKCVSCNGVYARCVACNPKSDFPVLLSLGKKRGMCTSWPAPGRNRLEVATRKDGGLVAIKAATNFAMGSVGVKHVGKMFLVAKSLSYKVVTCTAPSKPPEHASRCLTKKHVAPSGLCYVMNAFNGRKGMNTASVTEKWTWSCGSLTSSRYRKGDGLPCIHGGTIKTTEEIPWQGAPEDWPVRNCKADKTARYCCFDHLNEFSTMKPEFPFTEQQDFTKTMKNLGGLMRAAAATF